MSDRLGDGRTLLQLKAHAGFAILCALYDESLEKLQAAINDETHDGDETQRNKRARAALTAAHPKFLVEQAAADAHKEFIAETSDQTTRRT
jgi:hypothetical protein